MENIFHCHHFSCSPSCHGSRRIVVKNKHRICIVTKILCLFRTPDAMPSAASHSTILRSSLGNFNELADVGRVSESRGLGTGGCYFYYELDRGTPPFETCKTNSTKQTTYKTHTTIGDPQNLSNAKESPARETSDTRAITARHTKGQKPFRRMQGTGG